MKTQYTVLQEKKLPDKGKRSRMEISIDSGDIQPNILHKTSAAEFQVNMFHFLSIDPFL